METQRIFKQRLAVFLSIAMALTMLLGSTPQMQTTAQAASSVQISGINGIGSSSYNGEALSYFAVEADQTVPIGYLFEIRSLNTTFKGYLAEAKNVTYSLDKTSLATISAKGVLKTKAEGTIQGTVRYKGARLRFAVKILKAGKLGTNSSKYNKIRSLVTKIKKYNGKLTAKNCYQYNTLVAQYQNTVQGFDSNGLKWLSGSYTLDGLNMNMPYMPCLVFPLAVGFNRYISVIDHYTLTDNPVGTLASKVFKVKKVTAKKNTKNFTITLDKKATLLQIFTIKKYYAKDTVIKNDKTARFPIYIKDQKTGYTYYGVAAAREGSKEIKVTMNYLKFKPGHKYQTVSAEMLYPFKGSIDWTRKKTVTIR